MQKRIESCACVTRELEKEHKGENQVHNKEGWWVSGWVFSASGASDELNTILGWINRNIASGTRRERAPLHSMLDLI